MINWADLRVLVTGGTGSFGNFIVRHLLNLRAKEVRILSRDEKKQHDMRVFYGDRSDLTFVIGNIRDRNSVDEAMENIDIVFQAAALKQVPTCEHHLLLTLNKAIDLVLYAAEATQGGEVFVRKAPAACVLDIAHVLCEEVERPFEYDIIGMLPGEKLNEILISEEELERTENCGDYYKIHPWWGQERPRELAKEYCSPDALVEIEGVRQLIKRADQEFEAMEIPDGEFAKF